MDRKPPKFWEFLQRIQRTYRRVRIRGVGLGGRVNGWGDGKWGRMETGGKGGKGGKGGSLRIRIRELRELRGGFWGVWGGRDGKGGNWGEIGGWNEKWEFLWVK